MPRPENFEKAARCQHVTRHGNESGRQCKNVALAGTTECRKHGGTLPSVLAKRDIELSKREAARRGIAPLSRDDPRGKGDAALAEELRRTIAWIDFCESQLNALGVTHDASDDETDAVAALSAILGGLQVTKRETIGAAEFGGVNVTEEVRVNVWEEKLRWNRTHLAILTKQWLAAGFEARRLELARDSVERIERMMNGIVRDLGHNAADPEVRAVVLSRIRRELASDGGENGSRTVSGL